MLAVSIVTTMEGANGLGCATNGKHGSVAAMWVDTESLCECFPWAALGKPIDLFEEVPEHVRCKDSKREMSLASTSKGCAHTWPSVVSGYGTLVVNGFGVEVDLRMVFGCNMCCKWC